MNTEERSDLVNPASSYQFDSRQLLQARVEELTAKLGKAREALLYARNSYGDIRGAGKMTQTASRIAVEARLHAQRVYEETKP